MPGREAIPTDKSDPILTDGALPHHLPVGHQVLARVRLAPPDVPRVEISCAAGRKKPSHTQEEEEEEEGSTGSGRGV